MSVKMTWDEICSTYPRQWVGLDDVKFVDDDGTNVDTAAVVCAVPDEEYSATRVRLIKEGHNYFFSRTSFDDAPQSGVMV